MSNAPTRELSGPEKAAVLMLALGSEKSAQLVSGLAQSEIELLATHIALLKNVDETAQSQVLQEFEQSVATGGLASGGLAFARDLLTQALGEERAAGVISRLEATPAGSDFSIEGEQEAARLGRLLRNQHAQVAAVILAQMPPAVAGRALGTIPKEMQLQVALRLLDMDSPDAAAFRRLGETLRTGLLSEQPYVTSPTDGTRRLAEILNSAEWETEQGVLAALNECDPKLGKQVRDRMFVFDDLIDLESRDLQLVLRSISQDDLRIALSAAGEKLKEFILSNMSERAAAALKEDMDAAGPVKPRQARAAQQRVAAAARQLAREGTMTLKSTTESEAEEGEEAPEESAPEPEEEAPDASAPDREEEAETSVRTENDDSEG
jgi:flagellar motor switch protein FliG